MNANDFWDLTLQFSKTENATYQELRMSKYCGVTVDQSCIRSSPRAFDRKMGKFGDRRQW
jgi:hypothetical protein